MLVYGKVVGHEYDPDENPYDRIAYLDPFASDGIAYVGGVTKLGGGVDLFQIGQPLSTYFTELHCGLGDEVMGYTSYGDIDLTQVINAQVYEIEVNPVVPEGEG